MTPIQARTVNSLIYREVGKHYRALNRLDRQEGSAGDEPPWRLETFETTAKRNADRVYHQLMIDHYNQMPDIDHYVD